MSAISNPGNVSRRGILQFLGAGALLSGAAVVLDACGNPNTPPEAEYVTPKLLVDPTKKGLNGAPVTTLVGYEDKAGFTGSDVKVLTLFNDQGRPYQIYVQGPSLVVTLAALLTGTGNLLAGTGSVLGGVAAIKQSGQQPAPLIGSIDTNAVGTGGTATNNNTVNTSLSALLQSNPQLNASLTADQKAYLQANPQVTTNLSNLIKNNPNIDVNTITKAISDAQAQQQQQQQQPGQPPKKNNYWGGMSKNNIGVSPDGAGLPGMMAQVEISTRTVAQAQSDVKYALNDMLAVRKLNPQYVYGYVKAFPDTFRPHIAEMMTTYPAALRPHTAELMETFPDAFKGQVFPDRGQGPKRAAVRPAATPL